MDDVQNWEHIPLYTLINESFFSPLDNGSVEFNVLPLAIYDIEKDSLFVTKDNDFKILTNGTLFYENGGIKNIKKIIVSNNFIYF
jgi:hypothetical protein